MAGLPGQSGDPSPVTGYGVYVGMKAAAKVRWGKDSLAGKPVAVQGARQGGAVPGASPARGGRQADRHRHRRREGEAGGGRVRRRGGGARRDLRRSRPTSTPRARSGPRSTTRRSRGSRSRSSAAAPTTSSPRSATATQLEKRGILYAPDYVINGGGVINVYGELRAGPEERALEEGGGRSTTRCCASSRSPSARRFRPTEAADRLAEERMAAVRAWREVRRQ